MALAILLLAFAVQFFRLDARTLHGDELLSIREASSLGLNPNGILYFALIHVWMWAGVSEFWLRTPSVLFAVAAVAVIYALGTALVSRSTGAVMALMLATAPFLVPYAQYVRFYSLFLFAASLSYLALTLFLQSPTRRNAALLLVTDLLVLGSHFFATLVVASQALVSLLFTRRISLQVKAAFLGALGLMLLALTASFSFRSFVYEWVSRLTNPYGDATYAGAKGLSVANVAKIPLTFFFFGFGEHIYPLSFGLVIPGLALLTILTWFGAALLWRRRLAISLTSTLLVFPTLVYGLFDALAAPTLPGAAPRHLFFLLPCLYLLLAAGIIGSRLKLGGAALLLTMNLASLSAYWYGDWAYTDDRVDWREVTRWISGRMAQGTVLLLDGRSQELAGYYFPPTWPRQNQWTYLQGGSSLEDLARYSRVVFASNDFHTERRAEASGLMRRIEGRYDRTAVWSQYPLFVYVYDQKPASVGEGSALVAEGSVTLPVEIFGLEFQDLRLPLTARVGSRSVGLSGSFALPGLDGQQVRRIALAAPAEASAVVLLSNITGGGALEPGTPVAALRVEAGDGRTAVLPLRAGFETGTWNGQCEATPPPGSRTGACESAFRWRKRLTLLGSERYAEAWQEFDAAVFGIRLALPRAMLVRRLALERLESPGVLHIWGIMLER